MNRRFVCVCAPPDPHTQNGIVDFRIETNEKIGEEARSLMRIRLMKNVGFDGRWHPLKINDNFEITLENAGDG